MVHCRRWTVRTGKDAEEMRHFRCLQACFRSAKISEVLRRSELPKQLQLLGPSRVQTAPSAEAVTSVGADGAMEDVEAAPGVEAVPQARTETEVYPELEAYPVVEVVR